MAGFAEQAGEIGSGIAAFLNPIIGGKETSTTTSSMGGNTTTLIIVVVFLLVVGFVVFGPKGN